MDAPPMPIGTRRSAFFRWRLAGLICLLVLLLATLSSPFWLSAHSLSMPLPSQAIRGVVVFSSSGQLDPTSATGLNDQVTVQIEGMPAPPAGKSEYAWLLPDPDQDELPPVLLGKLGEQKGQASSPLHFADPQHTDLLASYSRFLLTEEPTDPAPILPSQNPATWLASGSIPDIPTPEDPNHFSYLDHLRHLLAADPDLQRIGLSGGLDIWLYRNAEKILEWASAARDDWSDVTATDLLRREIIRIVDYLDGTLYAGRDVPAGTPLLVNRQDGRIGLMEQVPLQHPPAYLAHIDLHLNGLIHAPGATPGQRQLAARLDAALRRVTALMESIHSDAVQIVRMSDRQLQQESALSLLNDLTTQATLAFVGQPVMGTQGISWIHDELATLAMIPLAYRNRGYQPMTWKPAQ